MGKTTGKRKATGKKKTDTANSQVQLIRFTEFLKKHSDEEHPFGQKDDVRQKMQEYGSPDMYEYFFGENEKGEPKNRRHFKQAVDALCEELNTDPATEGLLARKDWRIVYDDYVKENDFGDDVTPGEGEWDEDGLAEAGMRMDWKMLDGVSKWIFTKSAVGSRALRDDLRSVYGGGGEPFYLGMQLEQMEDDFDLTEIGKLVYTLQTIGGYLLLPADMPELGIALRSLAGRFDELLFKIFGMYLFVEEEGEAAVEDQGDVVSHLQAVLWEWLARYGSFEAFVRAHFLENFLDKDGWVRMYKEDAAYLRALAEIIPKQGERMKEAAEK